MHNTAASYSAKYRQHALPRMKMYVIYAWSSPVSAV